MNLQLQNNNANNRHINKKYKAGRTKIKHIKKHSFTSEQMENKWINTLENIERIKHEIQLENMHKYPSPHKIEGKMMAVTATTANTTTKKNPCRIVYSSNELRKLQSKAPCRPMIQGDVPRRLIQTCSPTSNKYSPTRKQCIIIKYEALGTKTYKIMHHNTGGLSYATKAEINHQLEAHDIDIICLNETKLTPNKDLTLYGYNCIARKDRPAQVGAGGVAIYAKPLIKIVQVDYQSNEELIVVELTTHGNHTINIISMYNPPDRDLDIEIIKEAMSLNKKTILLGDLNAKHTGLHNNRTNRSGRNLLDLLMHTNISIRNNEEPTHVPYVGEPDRLDLALATPELTPNIGNFTVCDRDAIQGHAPIKINITTKKQVEPTADQPMPYNYERADWLKFRETINQKLGDDNPIQTQAQLDGVIKKLVAAIKEAADNCIPRCQKQTYSAKLPNWIGVHIRNRHAARREHQRQRNAMTRIRYNAATREVAKAISQYKQNNWDKITEKLENQKDPRKFWPLFRKLTKGKTPLEYNKLRNPHTNNKPVTTREAAQIFNDQLHETMNQLVPNIQENRIHMLVNTWFQENLNRIKPLASTEDNTENHNLTEPFSDGDIINAIKQFRPRKAPGPDGLQMILYKELPVNAIQRLKQSYNAALKLGYFPAHYKKAKVIMLPKPFKTRDNPKNYRPISLTNTIGKIFERLLHTRMMRHLQNIGFLSSNQHGFKPKTGTADQMVKILYQIKKDQGMYRSPLLAALDLEKAFDKVWHKGLLYKLSNIPDLPITYLRLITSFLHQRKIFTSVKNEISTTFTPKAGVPQGSILSPLLFNIFVNDIQNIPLPPNTHIYQYADDTCILSSAKQRGQLSRHYILQNQMNQALQSLQDYFTNWKLKANPDKTQLIAVTQIRPKRIKREVQIRFANTNIPFAPTLTLLGNVITPSLNMNCHIKHTKTKTTRAINKLKVLNTAHSQMSTKSLGRLYKVLVRSVMEYCPQYTLLATEAQLQSLQRSQNRALRQAIRAHHYVPNTMVQGLFPDIPPIKDRLQKLVTSYIHKAQNPDIAAIIREIAQTPIQRESLRPILYNQVNH